MKENKAPFIFFLEKVKLKNTVYIPNIPKNTIRQKQNYN